MSNLLPIDFVHSSLTFQFDFARMMTEWNSPRGRVMCRKQSGNEGARSR